MIELLRIRIQRLNGHNVISQESVDPKNKRFETEEALEYYRKKKELMLQFAQDKKNKKTGDDTRVEVLFDKKEVPVQERTNEN